eukprot:2465399-Pleurochrysis_carterae.AAC.3
MHSDSWHGASVQMQLYCRARVPARASSCMAPGTVETLRVCNNSYEPGFSSNSSEERAGTKMSFNMLVYFNRHRCACIAVMREACVLFLYGLFTMGVCLCVFSASKEAAVTNTNLRLPFQDQQG